MVNLTPKEKAEDLVNKFLKQSLWMYQAKGCALIAVDEILNIYSNNFIAGINYWKEVKQEINNI